MRQSQVFKPGKYKKRLAVIKGQFSKADHVSESQSTVENEDLRAKIKALQYQVDNLKQERDYAGFDHEKKLKDAVIKAEEEFRASQVRRLAG